MYSEEIVEAAKRKDWEEVAELGEIGGLNDMQLSFAFYKYFPEEIKRRFALGCYMHKGDWLPCCRSAVRKLEKRGLQELPEEYADKQEIIVYRGGEEEPNKAKYRLSWTLDKEKAAWFYNHPAQRANYLYRAKIKPCDVIAFLDDRNEKEILQYRKVYDIEILEKKGGDTIG